MKAHGLLASVDLVAALQSNGLQLPVSVHTAEGEAGQARRNQESMCCSGGLPHYKQVSIRLAGGGCLCSVRPVCACTATSSSIASGTECMVKQTPIRRSLCWCCWLLNDPGAHINQAGSVHQTAAAVTNLLRCSCDSHKSYLVLL